MKKFLLLIPALLLSLMVNATTVSVSPGTKTIYTAYNSATAGAILELADGTYDETERLVFNKDITIKAADGAIVIVKPHKDNQIKEGAKVKFIGIKFDGSEMSTYEYFIRSYDATAGKELRFEGCEMSGFTGQYLINAAGAERTLDSVIINDCKCINNGKDAIYIAAGSETQETAKGVIVKNSTFANFAALAHSVIEVDNYGSTKTPNIEVTVDHCTFYNNPTSASGYADIRVYKSTKVAISNCIFAHPEAYARCGTYCYGGTINNCLSYNLTSGTKGHRADDIDLSTCLPNADPLFTDAANGDFSLIGNWETMSISPARYAGTDGSHLGDPRWDSAETLPSTNFAAAYDLLGTKAVLSGRIGLNGSNKIHFNHNSEVADGTAKWKLHVGKSCVVNALVDVEAGCTSGRQLTLTVKDAADNTVATLAQPSATYNDADIDLGQITFPGEGDYTFILTNSLLNSGVVLEKITLSYIGGTVQSMPGTTDIDDAWFSSNGTRTAGEYISIPSGHQHEGWVKWNVSFASAANYNVTVTIDNANGHNYTVALYRSESDESPITLGEGGQKSTIGTIELGSMEVPAGNYIMKVTNATQYSDAKLISVNFAYAGGAAVNLSKDAPASLLANSDAILSDDWTIEGGKITHTESKALTGWAKWNVNSADYGNYNVTVNISSDNGHLVRVEIFDDEAKAPIYTLDETSATQYHTGDQAIDLGNIILDEHEYVVKVSNTGEYSHVQIASIVITYQNGARATLPASCTFTDLMLSPKAHVTEGNLWFNTIGDSDPVGQWAKWNVKVATNGTFLFTMNVTSSNSQTYKITVLDSEENIIDSYEKNPGGSGDKTITHYLYLAAGDYIVKLENTHSWSQGHVVSLVVTQPSLLVLDEAATNNSVIVDHYRPGSSQPIQIIRTIVKDMYNTICLPFDVNSAQLQQVFGNDVVLKQLESSSLDASGEILDLNFESATSIYRGTPYIIKTSRNIVNPVFDSEIKEKVGQATTTTYVDFLGNFVAGTIPASEDNLFIGANNTLYFPLNDIEILGMRAYFQIKSGVRALVKGARIVEHESTATGIENIMEQPRLAGQKVFENGQIVIIRDGIRYNIMGVRMN